MLGSQLDDPRSPLHLSALRSINPRAATACGITSGPDGAFDLVAALELSEGAVRAKFRLENEPPASPGT